ncbi:4-hydroxyacetophenone monooxygenase [Cryobacterium flavum]|nr:NAD(P)/FAD-dependent oxidoreductase [Cryobacterium flavum]SDO24193.1 4-hydroxyacetophenone monooxygenase [Cryobacterium flavum]
MTAEQQLKAREISFCALRRYRDNGFSVAAEPDQELLQRLMSFIAAEADDTYLPLLSHELNIPEGVSDPDWNLAELAPGRQFRVAVIGAGMSGVAAAFRLKQAGVDFVVFEKNPSVGGTWYENSYPGCRLDTHNFAYSYSFAQKRDWPYHYSQRDDIFGYFSSVAEKKGLLDSIRFETTVLSAAYRATDSLWALRYRTADGEVLEYFNAVISAVGQLNNPMIPDFVGANKFTGEAWHTAAWRHDVDLKGKRVAVIGAGASAFQVIPAIASEVDHLTVFQRNAPWMYPTPNYLEAIPLELSWLFDVIPFYARWFRFFQFWTAVEGRRRFVTVDPEWSKAGSVSAQNEHMRKNLTSYLEEQFAERPDLLTKVIPTYPPGAKRLLRDDGTWARTLKRPNVALETEAIAEFYEHGIRTADGVEHEVDVIIYGTGFTASDFLSSVSVTGVAGRDLHEYWADDARAYLGISIPGFPNLFCLYGPNTNLVVNGSIVLFSELAVNYVLDAISGLLRRDEAAIDCRQDIYDAYNRQIDEGNGLMAWGASEVSSWYKNKFGRVSQNWPFPLIDYWSATSSVDREAYDSVPLRVEREA